MYVTYCGKDFPCSQAERGSDYIALYNATGGVIGRFSGVTNMDGFTLQGGDWSNPAPTQGDVNAANIEYIAMMSDIELEV